MAYARKTVSVCFCHDLEDGWYEAKFPDRSLDGAYNWPKSISKLAKTNGWKIRWFGDQRYNPWKKTK